MNQNVLDHIETRLATVRSLFEKAAARIETLKPGEKIPATELAKELAKDCGSTGPALYPTLKILFEGYPGVEIRRGAHGGIFRSLPAVVPVVIVNDETVTEETIMGGND
jgi:hypothetical protein